MKRFESQHVFAFLVFVGLVALFAWMPFGAAERIAEPNSSQTRVRALGLVIAIYYLMPYVAKSISMWFFFQVRIPVRFPEFLLRIVFAFSRAFDSASIFILLSFWFLPELQRVGIQPIVIPLTVFSALLIYRLLFRYRGVLCNHCLNKPARAAYENSNNQLCLEQARQLIIENKPFMAIRSLSSKLRLNVDEAENLLTHIAMDGEDHLFYLDRAVAK
ncbi:MAG: hypothetical protein KF824_10760 [Fimbriimonadaceae bacterium]|nr:MAG: hypothetical protein KF824_10760 [Fimbriimonadaceae bacterium]